MRFMLLKKEWLAKSNFYLILDTSVLGFRRLREIAAQLSPLGVDIVQLRDKHCSDEEYVERANCIAEIVQDKALFVINDRVHLAKHINPDGLHLGQEDASIEKARDIVGYDKLVGLSCQTAKHLERAQERGADYIGFGSVYKTFTKPDREPMDLSFLENSQRRCHVPLFAIGGITLENITPLIERGVRRVALTRAILEADNRIETLKRFKQVLAQATRAQSIN